MSDPLNLDFDQSPLASDAFFKRRIGQVPIFESPPLRPDVRAMAQRAWIDRARSEYIGVMISRRFWELLVDINAPVDIQELALTMVLDEQRHTKLCIAAATHLGASSDVNFDLDELQQQRSHDLSLHEQTLKMIIQTYCIGEVTALGLVKHAMKQLPSSGYKTVLEEITRDEVLHARIGPGILKCIRSGQAEKWMPWPGDNRVRKWVSDYVNAMQERDVVEDADIELFGDPGAHAQLLSVGIPEASHFKSAYYRSLNDDVKAVLGDLFVAPRNQL